MALFTHHNRTTLAVNNEYANRHQIFGSRHDSEFIVADLRSHIRFG
ncbi:MAG: hypothetical protein OSB46_13495 [Alphaproteobacteria bacterium]|nr:hypothetical protein [Alphaproteobacteria bacterium]